MLTGKFLSYLVSESDLNVVLRAVRLAQRVARTGPLASMLDLRPQEAGRHQDNIYWVGDVDPDQVRPIYDPMSITKINPYMA